MPDVLLLGATGFTGRLVAQALGRRGVDFAVAGRDPSKLEDLAGELGAETRVADVRDRATVVRALSDVGVLITCVGPFLELGWTAAEAAIEAGVHYVDSTGEGRFIELLRERYDRDARERGIAMVPAMAFDEVPADVGVSIAAHGMDEPELVLTYSVPTAASRGTVRSSINVMTERAPFIEDGEVVRVGAGERRRWSPMPPPLGPKPAVSAPLAETYLAPLHLNLSRLECYVTVDPVQQALMRPAMTLLRGAKEVPLARQALQKVLSLVPQPTGDRRSKRWTILVEARDRDTWRNVVVVGADVYGLSGELLAAAGAWMSGRTSDTSGVLSPVQAVGTDTLRAELERLGTSIDVIEPVSVGS